MKRQNVRKLLIIISLLLFPITIWYFSPYLIIQGALEHMINGSFIVFMLMLIGSIFFGRVFCGYICPAGGLQECTSLVNDKNAKQGWRNKIKYVIWIIWISAIILCFVLGKNNVTINPFYMTDHGISVSNIYCYIIYYGVIGLIFIPAVLCGKRAFCHYFCWMAPFMVIGSSIGRKFHILQLHVESDKEKCISCNMCSKKCPMGLDVRKMVDESNLGNSECILCGQCIDACPKNVLQYKFKTREEK